MLSLLEIIIRHMLLLLQKELSGKSNIYGSSLANVSWS